MNENLFIRATFPLSGVEVRATEDGKKKATGYAARFEKLSVKMYNFREKIRSGAFKSSLKENNIRALWNHNPDIVLGATGSGTLKLEEDSKGLRFDIDLPDTQAGKDAAISIARGDVDGMSFGFRVRKQEWDETDSENIVRTLVDVDCREISFTAFPAYPDTNVKVRSIKDDYADYKKEGNENDLKVRENELELKLRAIEAL